MSTAATQTPIVVADRNAFRAWAEAQPQGRFERIAGAVVGMAPERGAHLRIKAAVWLALRQAIAAAGVPCEALPDGATVEVGEDTDYKPDAVGTCGERTADDAIAAPNPVVVVEVISPSTRALDTGAKRADYFRVSSVEHYLVVRTDRREVIHYRRALGGGLSTQAVSGGVIDLAPPGICVGFAEFYAA